MPSCQWQRPSHHAMTRALLGLLLAPLLIFGGCENEQRIPYIPPTLHNWPSPYKGLAGLRVEAFVTGWLRVRPGLVYRGGSLTRERLLPVLAFAIHHPREGVILFGTGLNHRIGEHANDYLGGLPGLLMQPQAYAHQDLPSQLAASGIEPSAIHWIILTDLQFDSAGELRAFPHARVVVTRDEHDYARNGPGGYLSREYADVESWKLIDFSAGTPLGTFESSFDLFGDGSCVLLDTDGYAPGSMALLVRLPSAPLLLAGDLALVSESIRYTARPASLYDANRWWDNIWRLKRFHDLDPHLQIVPAHDVAPLWLAPIPELVLHDYSPPED